MSSNPYPDGSKWWEYFELDPQPNAILFRQPSGLSDEAENVENLPDGYYERLCDGQSQEFINVAVHGLNGQDLSGAAVFGSVFDFQTHTVPDTSVLEGRTFIIGLDTDRNPAALIAQRGLSGELIVHEEVYAEGMGLEAFITGVLTPTMYERYFGSAYMVVDPSAVRRSSITEESQEDALIRMGYDVMLAGTNQIEARLRGVESLFMTSNKGRPGIVISRHGCPMLISALSLNYKYGRTGKGELTPKPLKTHPFSDLADALGYLAQGFTTARSGRAMGRRRQMALRQQGRPPRVLGWT